MQDFALDASFARFCPEFLASIHLWLAVHAHRTRDAACSPAVISHAEEACKVIRSMVPIPVPRLSMSRKVSIAEPAPVRRPTRTTRTTKAAPKAKAPTTRARAPPVTPKKRRGACLLGFVVRCANSHWPAALDPVSLNAAVNTPPRAAQAAAVTGKMDFDDFAKFIRLIRTCYACAPRRICELMRRIRRYGFSSHRPRGPCPCPSSAPQRRAEAE